MAGVLLFGLVWHLFQNKLKRLPAYLTIQMVRFFYKGKEAVNAKILKVTLSIVCCVGSSPALRSCE